MATDETTDQPTGPEIGRDEWVARVGERGPAPTSRRERIAHALARVPVEGRFAAFVAIGAIVPLLFPSDYILRVGVNTLIFALLAVGLNVEVGWLGALDLGYIAIFGLGAYLYALLASDHFHAHWPTALSVPLIMVATAIASSSIGLAARRLAGDYYAIATLFFAEAFLAIVTNADRITFPFAHHAIDITGGPNGIIAIDTLHPFGLHLSTVRSLYYYALIVLSVVVVAVYLAGQSRTGRGWRAIRDDSLAAEMMGMPANHLRMVAFALSGAIAGLAGTTVAAVQAGVFPGNFDLSLLIFIYAVVILGGMGSITGVICGAIALNVTLEFLRNPDHSRTLFYVVVVVALLRFVRPWWIGAVVIAATFLLGIVVRLIADNAFASSITSSPIEAGHMTRLIDRWVIVLNTGTTIGNAAYVALLVSLIVLTRIGYRWRLLILPAAIYLSAFVWENRLADNPGVTRLILLGMTLIVFMNVRPRGLFGSTQVEQV